ncbi:hypothetical protein E2C01_098173 [Portunus trituberculatus]|uniref:Uncharacterized protein n=1 Tax=Portunus trituberculatus TaxID=210409 RepID=A0A5B7JX44_PORTR|nr:hypothetical protein [Portunus trituberculatus]
MPCSRGVVGEDGCSEKAMLDVREGSFDITPVSSCFYIVFDAIRTPDTCLSSAHIALKKRGYRPYRQSYRAGRCHYERVSRQDLIRTQGTSALTVCVSSSDN